ncbi:MAG: response regulator transcription factor [Planctomycetota bacterium]|nr:response regulator transcription factor [Planctomycetota bacterium]
MIRIVLADDHDIVRSGLRGIIDETDIEVVGEANSGKSVLALVENHQPDLVILDVRMPDGDGLQALGRIKSDFPNIPVLMLSTYDNPTFIARAAALGANGYVLKSENRDGLLNAIRRAASGDLLWTREEMRRVSSALAAVPSNDAEVPLTKREGEVLQKIALGLTNREIAKALEISYETVKEHVQHILRKVGVSDRTQAAVWAVRKGIV